MHSSTGGIRDPGCSQRHWYNSVNVGNEVSCLKIIFQKESDLHLDKKGALLWERYGYIYD